MGKAWADLRRARARQSRRARPTRAPRARSQWPICAQGDDGRKDGGKGKPHRRSSPWALPEAAVLAAVGEAESHGALPGLTLVKSLLE